MVPMVPRHNHGENHKQPTRDIVISRDLNISIRVFLLLNLFTISGEKIVEVGFVYQLKLSGSRGIDNIGDGNVVSNIPRFKVVPQLQSIIGLCTYHVL